MDELELINVAQDVLRPLEKRETAGLALVKLCEKRALETKNQYVAYSDYCGLKAVMDIAYYPESVRKAAASAVERLELAFLVAYAEKGDYEYALDMAKNGVNGNVKARARACAGIAAEKAVDKCFREKDKKGLEKIASHPGLPEGAKKKAQEKLDLLEMKAKHSEFTKGLKGSRGDGKRKAQTPLLAKV